MSVEEVVAKAKAIAAKLSGGGDPGTVTATTNEVNPSDIARAAEAALQFAAAASTLTSAGAASESGSVKRKRWGVTPDGDNDDATTTTPEKRIKHEAQKRMWISTANKPASHYRLYWEMHGPAITRQVSSGEIALRLEGRGSSKIPALPGIPEQPLHIVIEGPTMEACENAEQLVEALFVAKADQVDTMIDAEDAVSTAASATTASNGTADGYRPAPVASLIHNPHAGAMPGTLLEEQIGVPNGIVGFIIGRGGESIASMQARTGCKVQIQKENEMQPGQTQRVITLQATTKEAIDQCRSIIQGMVNERTQTTSREVVADNNSQESRLQEAVQAGHIVVTVAVPDTDVGLIIGKAGSTIKGIQDRSGANIQIPQTGDVGNPSIRTVTITHPHVEGANLAKHLIEDILGSKRNQAPHITIQVEIPDKDVGMCIGRSGCVIREMQNQSGTKIQIPSFSTPGLQTRIATVTGPAEGCERVKQMIERIVLEQSSQSVMSGVAGQGHDQYAQSYGGGGQGQPYSHGQNAGAFGGYGGQPQAYGMPQQQSGAQDYSKEWAAYYAAQGAMHGNGGATESYGVSATAAVTEAASAVTAQADTYYEQFFRYAYYYGEEAARSHYGAWSPPPGTPNPYGVNPNGITQAPTAAAEQHVAQAPAPVAYSQSAPAPAAYSQSAPAPAAYSQSTPAVTVPLNVRDSGRRGVSNLPAWMTKG